MIAVQTVLFEPIRTKSGESYTFILETVWNNPKAPWITLIKATICR